MKTFSRKQGKYIKTLNVIITVLAVIVAVWIVKIIVSSSEMVYLPDPLPIERESLTTADGAVSPVRISIPRLGVETNIEHVGRTASGNMAVPADFSEVGWFREGYLPGEVGNAVVAGHVDDAKGNAAIFYNLSRLEEGDSVLVEGEEGTLEFRVARKKLYPYTAEDTSEVFGKSDKPMLNLITCDGTWDQEKRTYSDRLVVFAELVEPDTEESAVSDTVESEI